MSLVVKETKDSRKLNLDNKGATAEFLYFAYRSFDELAVHTAVSNAGPATYQGLVKRSVNVQSLGGGFWNGNVLYEQPEGIPMPAFTSGGSPDSDTPGDNDPLGEEFAFDTSGGTAHITQAIDTVDFGTLPGLLVPNNKNVIGWTADGKVEGVDIGMGRLELTYSRRIPLVTLAYIDLLAQATFTTNAIEFLGKPNGELLFLGAGGQYRRQDGWTVTFKFGHIKNEENIDVRGDGTLVVPAKKGWEFLEFGYRDEVENGRAISRPYVYYLHKVYKATIFQNFLGWGA